MPLETPTNFSSCLILLGLKINHLFHKELYSFFLITYTLFILNPHNKFADFHHSHSVYFFFTFSYYELAINAFCKNFRLNYKFFILFCRKSTGIFIAFSSFTISSPLLVFELIARKEFQD